MQTLGNPGLGQNRSRRAGGRAHTGANGRRSRAPPPRPRSGPPRLGLGLHAPLTGLQWAPNPSPYSRLSTTPQGKPKRQSSPVYEELRSRHGLQRAQARAAGAGTASWRAPLLRISALIGPSGACCRPPLEACADSSPGKLSH